MTKKIDHLKEQFYEIVRLCGDMDGGTILYLAIEAISAQMEDMTSDEDLEEALSLIAELMVHVNDMDDPLVEEINEIVEDIKHDVNS